MSILFGLILLICAGWAARRYSKHTQGKSPMEAVHAQENLVTEAAPDEPERWRRLDMEGRRFCAVAAENVAKTMPMGVPVGTTPAGAYVGIYWQYGKCHPIPAQQLTCTLVDEVSGTASGHGVDDVGNFDLRGEFRLAKLCLTKQYQLGTGNPNENLGHAVELRLMCCELLKVLPQRAAELQAWGVSAGVVGFYGIWHVRTPNYNGNAEMCLWLPPEPVVVGHVITQTTTLTQTQTAMDYNGDGIADGFAMAEMKTVTQTMTTNWAYRLRHPFGPKKETVQTAVPIAQNI